MAAPVNFSRSSIEIGISAVQNTNGSGFSGKSLKAVATAGVITGVFIFAARQLSPSFATKMDEGLVHLSERFSSTVVRPLRKTKRTMMERASNVTTKVVIGHSAMMTLGSLLLLPYQKNPEIIFARTARQFDKITLDQIEQLKCTPKHKMLLRVVKFLLDFRACFIPKAIEIVAEEPVLPLLLTGSYPEVSSSSVKITSLAAGTLAFLGFSLKFLAWDDTIQPVVHPVIHTDPHRSIANRQFTYLAPVALDVNDSFQPLPNELLVKIAQSLGERDLSTLALLSRSWRLISFSRVIREPLLRKKFGDPLVEAIGPYLLSAPWHALDTCVAKPGKILDPERRNTKMKCFIFDDEESKTNLLFEKNNSCNGVLEPIKGHSIPRELLVRLDHKGNWNFRDLNPLRMPCVTARHDTVQATPLLYFIEGSDFINRKVFLSRDAVGRYLIAFLFDICLNGSKRIEQGIGVLQETHPGSQEFVWIEKLPFRIRGNENGEIIVKKQEDPRNSSGVPFKQILFVLKDNSFSTRIYLHWLERLVGGEECGILLKGGEFKQPLHLQIQNNPIS